LGCWSNNVGNSHLSPGVLNSRVLRSCLVLQCYMPHSPCHQRRLANCDWMPASYTSGQSSCSRRHPTCKASRKGATLSPARRAMEHGHLLHSALTCPPSGNAGLSKLDIHLYPLHNNSSVHLTTITEVWRSGRGTDEMTKGWIAL